MNAFFDGGASGRIKSCSNHRFSFDAFFISYNSWKDAALDVVSIISYPLKFAYFMLYDLLTIAYNLSALVLNIITLNFESALENIIASQQCFTGFCLSLFFALTTPIFNLVGFLGSVFCVIKDELFPQQEDPYVSPKH